MTIKIKPQDNKKGAYIDCDIKTLSKEELDSLKKANADGKQVPHGAERTYVMGELGSK